MVGGVVGFASLKTRSVVVEPSTLQVTVCFSFTVIVNATVTLDVKPPPEMVILLLNVPTVEVLGVTVMVVALNVPFTDLEVGETVYPVGAVIVNVPLVKLDPLIENVFASTELPFSTVPNAKELGVAVKAGVADSTLYKVIVFTPLLLE